MAARLPTLCHDYVNPAGYRSARLLSAADRVDQDGLGGVDLIDIVGGVPPHQRYDPQPGLQRLVKTAVLVRVEDQVSTEGTVGERCRLADHVSGRRRPREGQHAQPPGIRNRGRQFRHRGHRCVDDGLLDPEHLAHRCPHHNLLFGSRR